MGRQQRYEDMAQNLMDLSNCKTAMVAFIISGGKIVSIGNNKKGYRAASLHAEVDALRRIVRQKNDASKADMYIFRFGGNNGTEPRMSKPCFKCMKEIMKAGIRRVFYYDWEGELHEIKVRSYIPENHYTINKWVDTPPTIKHK